MMVRRADVKDLKSIESLYSQLQPNDPDIIDGRDLKFFKEIFDSDYFFLFVGVVDTLVVSTCYLNLVPNLTRSASPYGIIENVVTDSSLRNSGYGKEIIKYALQFSWSRGCYKVMLQTGSKRESTHEFYKSCGFKAHDKFAFIARPK